MKLALFDIDGTLIKNKPSGLTTKLIKEIFGKEPLPINDDGLTMYDIFKQNLQTIDVSEEDERFSLLIERYNEQIEETHAKNPVTIIPGAEKLLQALQGKKVILALLTGNMERQSEVKLRHVGLWKYFSFGAYGDRTEKRADLVPLAIKMAKEKTGIEFDKKDIIIIGDTVKDVACAHDNNVKAVAIATGLQNQEKLAAMHPEYLFEDYKDIAAMQEAILE